MIALTLPQHTGTTTAIMEANNTTTEDASWGEYFPLANAVQSALRLAVDDVNALGTLMEGSLSLELLEVDTVMGAVEGLCEALHAVGENGTLGVSVFFCWNACIIIVLPGNDYYFVVWGAEDLNSMVMTLCCRVSRMI